MADSDEDFSIRSISVSHLTLGDAYGLIKLLFKYSYYSALVFGTPYILFYLLAFGVESVSVSTGYAGISKTFGWMLFGLVGVLVLKNLPELLNGIGKWLTDLAAVMGKLSQSKQFLLTAWAVAWIYLGSHYPKISFWLVVLIFIPGGLIYNEYLIIAARKASAQKRDNAAGGFDDYLDQDVQSFQPVILPPIGFTSSSSGHIKSIVWVLVVAALIFVFFSVR